MLIFNVLNVTLIKNEIPDSYSKFTKVFHRLEFINLWNEFHSNSSIRFHGIAQHFLIIE